MTNQVPDPGDWFSLRLSNGQFAHGLATRTHKRIYGLGYFFGPATDVPMDPADLSRAHAESAVLIGKFGFLGFKTLDWQVLGHDSSWREEDWPIPQFVRHEELTGKTYLVTYDSGIYGPVKETLVPPGHAAIGPEDGAMGHGFVVARVSRLLGV